MTVTNKTANSLNFLAAQFSKSHPRRIIQYKHHLLHTSDTMKLRQITHFKNQHIFNFLSVSFKPQYRLFEK